MPSAMARRGDTETVNEGRTTAVTEIERRFLLRMAMTGVQGIPRDWVGCSPILAALLDFAGFPRCAAGDARSAQALTAMGARLPIIAEPQQAQAQVVDVLLLEAPMMLTPEWTAVLSKGALVILRGSEGQACPEEGALNHVLDFENGLSIGLRPGCQDGPLRDIILACKQDRALTGAIVQMALVLQSRNAHVALASDAIRQRDARIALLTGSCTDPALSHPVPQPAADVTDTQEQADPTPDENAAAHAPTPPHPDQQRPSRLRRRTARLARRLGILRN